MPSSTPQGGISGGELPELAAAGRVAELAECLDLDLADALAGEPELAPNPLERPSVAIVAAEEVRKNTDAEQ